MSTSDVPGMNPLNRDDLHAGAWAEHVDGTLIYVNGTENDTVLYEVFDLTLKKGFRDTMRLRDFNRKFSYDSKDPKSARYTWHDKTEFPWNRVSSLFNQEVRHTSAKDLLDEAKAVRSIKKKTMAQPVKNKPVRLTSKKPKKPLKSDLTDEEKRLLRKHRREKMKEALKPKNEMEPLVYAKEFDEDEEPFTVTMAQRLAKERNIVPDNLEHADVAHKVEREMPKGSLAARMRAGIQSAINRLKPGRGE